MTSEPTPLTPTGEAIRDYRDKVIAELERIQQDWDHIESASQAIGECIVSIYGIDK